MPIANPITIEQATLLAVQSITVKNSVPSVEDIADRAGVSRQYLYKLANKKMREAGLVNEKAAVSPSTGNTAAAQSSTAKVEALSSIDASEGQFATAKTEEV